MGLEGKEEKRRVAGKEKETSKEKRRKSEEGFGCQQRRFWM